MNAVRFAPSRFTLDLSDPRAGFVPISEETAADLGWWPWLAPDPNPLPFIVCSDRLDALLAVWDEARLRFWVALDILRHGTNLQNGERQREHV